MKEVFTLQRSILRQGVVSLTFFIAMLLFGVIGMYLDAPSDCRLLAMLIVGVWWFGLAGLAIWVIFAYFRESISVCEGEVHFAGVITRFSVTATDILRARWRHPTPRLKLWTRHGQQTVWLQNFSPVARQRLMRFFRAWLNPEVQEGWDDSLEQYVAQVPENESAAAYRKVYRQLAWAIVGGPPAGLACGVILVLCAKQKDVVLPSWAGSLLIDWAAMGVLAGTAFTALMFGAAWMFRPDDE